MNKEELLIQLRKLHQELIKLVDKFPIEKKGEIIFDRWSLNDVLAHITAWNNQDILRFEGANSGDNPAKYWIEDLDAFNATEVNKAKSYIPQDIYSAFVNSGYNLIKDAEDLPEEHWQITIDPKHTLSLHRDFIYSIEHYKDEHIPQLQAYFASNQDRKDRIIIIGTSASGKSTVIKELRNNGYTLIKEIDEELMQLNGGKFPQTAELQHEVLAPKVIQNVLNMDNIIFFTNTDYFTKQDLEEAKKRGFTIMQLVVPLEELEKRNKYRMENNGYNDLSIYFEGMLRYQMEMRNLGLIDKELDGTLPVEEIIKQILV